MAVAYLNNASSIEIHYLFIDDSHNMDAFVENKCELDFLNFIKAVAKEYGEDIIIETEAIGEGGLRRWFSITKASGSKNPIISAALISAMSTALFITPLGSSITKVADKMIDKVFEDKEVKALETEGKKLDNEKKRVEIESVRIDTELKKQQLQKKPTIIKRRSNFYQNLSRYPKLSGVSFTIQDNKKNDISTELSVEKKQFNNYILSTDELSPIEINDAIIEIVSPVLKTGNYHWRGIYNGETISFNMKSNNFKNLVQNGTINFKNGTTIKCRVEISRKINNEGEEIITDYSVLEVDEYFDSDKPVKVVGVKKSRKNTDNRSQLDLFGNPE